MNAEEIRNTPLESVFNPDSNTVIVRDRAFFLREIAAQLAELNTTLRAVYDAVDEIALDGITVKVRQ